MKLRAILCRLSRPARLLPIFLLAGGILLGEAAAADPPARVGRISYASGPVSLAPRAGAPQAEEGEWSEAVVNLPVSAGDELWTDRGGRAEVHAGPTAWRVDEGSSLAVAVLEEGATQLRLAQGRLDVRLRRPTGRFAIDTPGASVELLSEGSYRIEVDPAGERTNVVVRSGRAHVTGEGMALALYDGQAAVIHEGAGYQVGSAPLPDTFELFGRARDERDDRAQSSRYVSPEITGYEELDAHGSWRAEAEYGPVWYPDVGADWAPFRHGRWIWVSPWGWTWIDDAPWGFAPSHYGRWVYVENRWGWLPGDSGLPPVYAPAVVAFVGGWPTVAAAGIFPGPVVGWYPLGVTEPFIPWYAASSTYVIRINKGHEHRRTPNRRTDASFHRHRAHALTAVPGSVFQRAQPVHRARLRAEELARLPLAPLPSAADLVAPGRDSIRVRPSRIRPAQRAWERPMFRPGAAARAGDAPTAAAAGRVIERPSAQRRFEEGRARALQRLQEGARRQGGNPPPPPVPSVAPPLPSAAPAIPSAAPPVPGATGRAFGGRRLDGSGNRVEQRGVPERRPPRLEERRERLDRGSEERRFQHGLEQRRSELRGAAPAVEGRRQGAGGRRHGSERPQTGR